MGAYPPLYYSVMNLFVGPDVTATVFVLRLINMLIVIGMALAAFLLLPTALRPVLVLSLLVTSVPLGLSLISTNNPTAWVVAGCGTAWLAMWGYLSSERRGRTIALGVLSTMGVVLAAGSRADAAVYVAVAIGAGAVLAFRSDRRFWRRLLLLLPLWAFCGAMFLVARQTGSAVNGFSRWKSVSGNQPDGSFIAPDPTALLVDNVLRLPSLWTGIFGGDWGLGWLDIPVPLLGTFAALLAAAGVGLIGLRVMSVRKALVVVGVAVVLAAVPLIVLQRSQASVGREVQPRYLLPLLVVFGGLLLFDVTGRHAIRLGFAQSTAIWAALTIAEVLALHATLRRYISGTDGGLDIGERPEWWWSWAPPPLVVLGLTSAAFSALAGLLLFVAHRQATRSQSDGFEGFELARSSTARALS